MAVVAILVFRAGDAIMLARHATTTGASGPLEQAHVHSMAQLSVEEASLEGLLGLGLNAVSRLFGEPTWWEGF